MAEYVTWEMLITADPRIAALLEASLRIARSGVEPTLDRIYCEAKRYLDVLVGWRRNDGDPIPRPTRPDEVDLDPWFEPVMALAVETRNHEWMFGEVAYNAACGHLHDAICLPNGRHPSYRRWP